MGQEHFPWERGWEPSAGGREARGGRERGAGSAARGAWGREAALRADTKSCNYIVMAQKHKSWERLRLGNRCWDRCQRHSPRLLVPPALQRVGRCPLGELLPMAAHGRLPPVP